MLDDLVFRVQNTAARRMTYSVSGLVSFTSPELPGWAIDFGSLNVQMHDMGRFLATYHQDDDAAGRESWQQIAGELGEHLYNGLLNVDESLARQLTSLRRRVRPSARLAFVFEGPREFLSVPYELLHDGRSPLAIHHPICRRIADIVSPHDRPLDVFARDLNGPLRVLLLASGEQAAGEIAALEENILWQSGQRGISVDVEAVSTGTPAAIRQKLAACPYHVVHYAGAVFHDWLNPASGGLLCDSRPDERLGLAVIPLRELASLFQNSQTQLFYLSGPITTGERDAAALRTDDPFDVIDTLVRAGIPYVIGLRWPTTGTGRQELAGHFYQHLFQTPSCLPERAMLYARRAVFPHDEAWASPILVAQHGPKKG